jgi:hypothetical protein
MGRGRALSHGPVPRTMIDQQKPRDPTCRNRNGESNPRIQLGRLLPAKAAKNLIGSMLAGNFSPQFPVQLIEKDFGYTVDAAGSPEAVPTIAAGRTVFQKVLSESYCIGLGSENMTSVVQMFTKSGT